MRFRHSVTLLLGAAALTLSCASAHKFAERSQQELAAGQTDKAYESALQAYRHDHDAPGVMNALGDAANARVDDWKKRVRSLAALDTLKAANQALALESFRREVVGYGVIVREDVAFANDEDRIRHAAAAKSYAQGVAEMRSDHAKAAYYSFSDARDFAPGYRDVDARMAAALKQAIQFIAFLPFQDETGAPGLSRALAERVRTETLSHLGDAGLPFTSFVTPDRVLDQMTVTESEHLTREAAIAVGRRVGAGRVLWGHTFAPSVNTNSNHYLDSIWRREEFKDTSGTRVRYVEERFAAVERQREASVRWEVEVIDVNNEQTIARREGTDQARARTVWTNFRPQGNGDNYSLVPPDMKAHDGSRAKRVESGWHDTFGDWKLPKLLDTARNSNGRSHYSSNYRHEFYGNTWDHPVFFDDLPDAHDMMYIALDDLWKPVLATIREQDAR